MRHGVTLLCLLLALGSCSQANAPASGVSANRPNCHATPATQQPILTEVEAALTPDRKWKTFVSPVKPAHLLLDALWLEIRGATDSDVSTVLRSCPNLKGLRLTQRVSGVDNLITDGGLDSLASLSGLVALEISGAARITDAGMKCLRSFPNLESLVLNGCPRLSGACLQHLVRPSRLLDFAASGLRLGVSLQDLLVFVAHGQVRSLRLLGSVFRGSADELSSIFELTPALTDLVLNGCRAVTDSVMAHLASSALFVEELAVAATSITDLGLSQVTKLKHLRTLDISNCAKLTVSGVQQIRSEMPFVDVHA